MKDSYLTSYGEYKYHDINVYLVINVNIVVVVVEMRSGDVDLIAKLKLLFSVRLLGVVVIEWLVVVKWLDVQFVLVILTQIFEQSCSCVWFSNVEVPS